MRSGAIQTECFGGWIRADDVQKMVTMMARSGESGLISGPISLDMVIDLWMKD